MFGPRRRRWHLAACAALLSLATLHSAPQGQSRLALDLLDAYAGHRYVDVQRLLREAPLEKAAAELKKAGPAWLELPAHIAAAKRAFVVAAVAAEIAHAAVERALLIPALGRERDTSMPLLPPDLVSWAQRLVRAHADASVELEHSWTLVGLATLEDWDRWAREASNEDIYITPEPAWAVLAGTPHLAAFGRVQDAFGDAGFLGDALRRFPHDPRLLLAKVEADEATLTRCNILFCSDAATPSVLEDLHQRTLLPAASSPPGSLVWGRRESAIANLAAFDRLPMVAAEFASLAADNPIVRAEADVHIGYLAIRAGRSDAALGPLAAAAQLSPDPFVRYLAEYLSGRALEAIGHPAEAVAAYRRALAVRNARSAAVLLAAHLLVSDDAADRQEAHRLLQTTLSDAPQIVDPWDRYWDGDARLWSAYVSQLREVLP